MEKILIENLISQDKSISEISKYFNISKTTLRYWMKNYGLKSNIPKYSERFDFRCSCGETDSKKFYGKKKNICGKCQNKYVTEVGRKKKKQAVEYLGGKCKICGYNEHMCSLDFHHIDGSTKDENFSSKRGWSWEKLKKELDKCILLCKNCHSAVHYDNLTIIGV